MARRKSPILTDAELRLMQVIWEKGSATAAEVLETLPHSNLAYTTVLNTLRILETKGYLRHTKSNKAFVYHPVVERVEATRAALSQLVSRFFGGSPRMLVSNLIKDEQLSKRDLQLLKKLIEESQQ